MVPVVDLGLVASLGRWFASLGRWFPVSLGCCFGSVRKMAIDPSCRWVVGLGLVAASCQSRRPRSICCRPVVLAVLFCADLALIEWSTGCGPSLILHAVVSLLGLA